VVIVSVVSFSSSNNLYPPVAYCIPNTKEPLDALDAYQAKLEASQYSQQSYFSHSYCGLRPAQTPKHPSVAKPQYHFAPA
jgi:hypothetical protein